MDRLREWTARAGTLPLVGTALRHYHHRAALSLCRALQRVLPESNVGVRGSSATGRAQPGASDIDVVVLSRCRTPEERAVLLNTARACVAGFRPPKIPLGEVHCYSRDLWRELLRLPGRPLANGLPVALLARGRFQRKSLPLFQEGPTWRSALGQIFHFLEAQRCWSRSVSSPRSTLSRLHFERAVERLDTGPSFEAVFDQLESLPLPPVTPTPPFDRYHVHSWKLLHLLTAGTSPLPLSVGEIPGVLLWSGPSKDLPSVFRRYGQNCLKHSPPLQVLGPVAQAYWRTYYGPLVHPGAALSTPEGIALARERLWRIATNTVALWVSGRDAQVRSKLSEWHARLKLCASVAWGSAEDITAPSLSPTAQSLAEYEALSLRVLRNTAYCGGESVK